MRQKWQRHGAPARPPPRRLGCADQRHSPGAAARRDPGRLGASDAGAWQNEDHRLHQRQPGRLRHPASTATVSWSSPPRTGPDGADRAVWSWRPSCWGSTGRRPSASRGSRRTWSSVVPGDAGGLEPDFSTSELGPAAPQSPRQDPSAMARDQSQDQVETARGELYAAQAIRAASPLPKPPGVTAGGPNGSREPRRCEIGAVTKKAEP